jgi:O-glycosyl hydrolase
MNRKLFIGITGILIAAALIAGCSLGDSSTAAKPIARPYISVQPQGASFYTDKYTAPTLSVEIYDWNEKDGKLSYKWYSFTDIEAYCAARSGDEVSGAESWVEREEDVVRYGSSYTPSITPIADDIYYFYVVITNSDSEAQGDTKAIIQSEVVAISFSDPGDPLYPVIAANPANASYGWGAQLNPLRVTATRPEGDNNLLTYQWFTSAQYSVASGTAIPDTDNRSITPDPNELLPGENFFFVKVTNTINNKSKTSIAVPAIINIQPGKRAAAPRITAQPKDALYFNSSAIAPLSVTAESLDMGTLSYQWYSNTDVKSSGGTLIAGATAATYAVPETKDGSYYYYVVVTNTNNNVASEDKTASAASKGVKVRIGNGTGGTDANVFITIPDTKLPANRFQYIRGYGGMDVAWGNFPRTTQEDTELMYNPDKMGYNMLRIMIRADNIDVEKTITDLINSDRPDYYENVKIVNKFGGYVAASPWTPPKEWKSNNSINGGGYLIPAYYKLFAQYLRNFAQHMYDHGAPIFAISISNEPNYTAGYDGCEWTPEEMRDFYKEIGHFTDGIRGYGGGRETPYVWTMNGESANTPYINNAALQDPESKAVIDVLARHIYGERTKSLWNDFPNNLQKGSPDDQNKGRLEVWMTEHNINSANATGYLNDSTWNYVWRYLNDVDVSIRMNNENAFVWWASKRFYSMVGDGQAGTTDGAPLPRGWALSHYAKFSIDYTRINLALTTGKASTYLDGPTTVDGDRVIRHMNRDSSMLNRNKDDMDNNSARITAFESEDGNSISLVLWTPTKTNGTDGINLGTVEVTLPPGFVANSVVAAKSWGQNANQLFQPDDSVVLSADRTKVYITIGASQIFSVRVSR